MAKTYTQFLNLLTDYLTGNDPTITSLVVGGRARTLLETVAQQLADVSQGIDLQLYQQAQSGVYDAFTFPRLPKTASQGIVVLTGTSGSAFPYGGLVSITPSPNTNTLTFSALNTYTIPSGSSVVSGLFQCTSLGSVGNINGGAITNIVTITPGVSSATNPSPFTGGNDQETSTARAERFGTYIASLSRGTPAAIQLAASEVSGVEDAAVVESPYIACMTLIGSTYTDNSTQANMPYSLGFSALGSPVNAGSAFMLASPSIWDSVYIGMVNPGSGLTGSWEYYSTSNIWNSLSIAGDNTNGLEQSGVVSWEPPSDWVSASFNDETGWWIRFATTSGGGVSPTVMFTEGLNPPVGFVDVVIGAMGQQPVSSGLLQSTEVAVAAVRGAGVTVNVIPVTYVTLEVTLTALIVPSADSSTVEQAVIAAVEDYLNGLGIGDTAYLQQIEQAALGVLGGSVVLSVVVSTPLIDTYVNPTSEIVAGAIQVSTQVIQ